MAQRGFADVIVGIQWGDEGKGRIVDLYAAQYDIVARFGGGDNAGHSIIAGDTKLALRIVPSGVLNPNADLFIGSGTVVSLSGLVAEMDTLRSIGVDTARIKISDRAHVVFPYHAERDRRAEAARGDAAIGTTGRGIGPAYIDRVARVGITFGDLADPVLLREKLSLNVGPGESEGAEEIAASATEFSRRVAPHVVDGVRYIHEALESGKRVLAEGAQGSLLDVGFGTYPFVTSSHTIAGAACTGLGIGPTAVRNVIGVAKAYATRVGAGPFPSELHDADGERLRKNGGEYGTVTGRPRRCGWFDGVAARYAVRLNGLSSAVLTKLDVLTGFPRVGIVTSYGRSQSTVAFAAAASDRLEPVLEYLPGWTEDITSVRRVRDLPRNAQAYVDALCLHLGVPVDLVSVGPERSQLAR
ncbi:MAG: adenylosuccinate synthase [Candidatus Meridianibacter frigidus]|nr:MAG: adenylosuccinate synthase [Candidatus Eremiobacteraeota bacterium]